MSIARTMVALLIGLLVSWGGLGGHGAHMAMAAQPSALVLDHAGMDASSSHAQMHRDHDGQQDAHLGHGAKGVAPSC
jgi:hypothetical protein